MVFQYKDKLNFMKYIPVPQYLKFYRTVLNSEEITGYISQVFV